MHSQSQPSPFSPPPSPYNTIIALYFLTVNSLSIGFSEQSKNMIVCKQKPEWVWTRQQFFVGFDSSLQEIFHFWVNIIRDLKIPVFSVRVWVLSYPYSVPVLLSTRMTTVYPWETAYRLPDSVMTSNYQINYEKKNIREYRKI